MSRAFLSLTLALFIAGPAIAQAAVFQLDLGTPGFSLTVQPNKNMEFDLLGSIPARDSYSVTIEDKLQEPFDLSLFGVASGEEEVALKMTPRRVQGGPYKLKKCQRLTVHVERAPAGEEQKIEWDFVFQTDGCGRWLTHYGFAFLPSEDDQFFTTALEADDDGAGGGFQITAENDRGEADFEPTITFSYLPKRDSKLTFTAGLGADIEERLVFAGVSYLFGDNVNIFLGAAGHEQTRLKGTYEAGQVLKEDLEADQLTDDTFGFNAIFGVGFRFNGNPFRKKADE